MALPSERIQELLKQVVTDFCKEDTAVRERQIRTWRRLKLFWEGFQQNWYSEVAHDWRIWDVTTTPDDTNQSYYDKPVNIFRAYLESIIAALSVTVPPVKCYPDDADDTLDLITAKTGDKIAQLLYQHNDVSLLWLHALFVFMTEGMVACYCYPKSDDSYGTYEKKNYEDVQQTNQIVQCPNCGYNLSEQTLGEGEELASKVEDKFMPDNEDVPVLDYIQNTAEQELCPSCMQMIDPMITKENFIVTRLVGVTNEPKTRICMEAYGGLYVRVPNYARNQGDCPYLIFSYETHYANALQKYPDLDNAKLRQKVTSNTGPKDPYEEWGRLNPQYNGEYPNNTVTIRNCWLRPAAFNTLPKEDADFLKKKYPSGVKVVLVNDEFAEACNEALDDCWTLTYNPMSDYIHADPLGLLLVSIQELTNDLISLTVQTIEHGIPQTFADPGVLNFDAYRQLEATPGGVYEATPKSGKSMSDGFYEVRTATLSSEVLPFLNQLQSLAQLVSGALPSLFGGMMNSGGSGTASEYSMSRAQALQRLQNNWKMLTSWWKNIFGKAIPMFIDEVKEDERDVQRAPDGSFMNVFIRKSELEGKIGKVELEANENLPITWNQRKDVLMQLLNAGNPEILAMLGSPENLPIIREAIGLDGFFVPGEDDRDKQLDEIKQLVSSEPIPQPPTIGPNGQPIDNGSEVPSVEVDPDNDNHSVEYEICRHWIISEAGRQTKTDNPNGYKNVLLHAKMHQQIMQQAQLMQQQEQMQQEMAIKGKGSNPEKPKQDTKEPIKGENNVQSIQ